MFVSVFFVFLYLYLYLLFLSAPPFIHITFRCNVVLLLFPTPCYPPLIIPILILILILIPIPIPIPIPITVTITIAMMIIHLKLLVVVILQVFFVYTSFMYKWNSRSCLWNFWWIWYFRLFVSMLTYLVEVIPTSFEIFGWISVDVYTKSLINCFRIIHLQ